MTQQISVLGLTGLPSSGKDTVAHFLARNYGYSRIAFADALREELMQAWLKFDDFWLIDPIAKQTKQRALAIGRCPDDKFVSAMALRGLDMGEARSPRQLLQLWGTEYRRGQDPAYWLRRAADRVAEIYNSGQKKIVFTDVRFPNEAELVRSYRGAIWKVHRIESLAASEHSSDHSMAGQTIDATIHNHGTIEQLELELDRILTHVARWHSFR